MSAAAGTNEEALLLARVLFDHVTKRYGDVVALSDFSLEVEDGEFFVLLGPSGCGKTTALRMVAGLEEISAGSVFIGERLVNEVPAKDRDLAMVFQSYALYPHMSVYNNIAFGLRMRKQSKEEIDRRVRDAAAALGIAELLERRPGQLSGGQQQRVALGRAIVRQPQAFLMDEPLSNLDSKMRVHMRAELVRLHRDLGGTFIYVTHDQVEAMTMGQRMAVLDGGLLQQAGRPQDVYDRPANLFVAQFIGSPQMNVLEGEPSRNDRATGLQTKAGLLPLSDAQAKAIEAAGASRVVAGIRPEHLEPAEDGVIEGEIDVIEALGSEQHVFVSTAEGTLAARLAANVGLEAGETLRLSVEPERVHLFHGETKERIE